MFLTLTRTPRTITLTEHARLVHHRELEEILAGGSAFRRREKSTVLWSVRVGELKRGEKPYLIDDEWRMHDHHVCVCVVWYTDRHTDTHTWPFLVHITESVLHS